MKFIATYDDFGRPLLPSIVTTKKYHGKRWEIKTHNIFSFICLGFILLMCAYIFLIGLAWTI